MDGSRISSKLPKGIEVFLSLNIKTKDSAYPGLTVRVPACTQGCLHLGRAGAGDEIAMGRDPERIQKRAMTWGTDIGNPTAQ